MRHLLNTLYVMTEEAWLSLDGENVVIQAENRELGRFPLHGLEGIISFSYRGASSALMGACAERGIDLCFFKPSGQFLARVSGSVRGNVLPAIDGHVIRYSPKICLQQTIVVQRTY